MVAMGSGGYSQSRDKTAAMTSRKTEEAVEAGGMPSDFRGFFSGGEKK
jgi:hypothetical protein